ncbi:hypothetical protein SAMN05421780_103172 [Flexibacter flexilis DSM 6793]|uniref:SGNH/GDSL hydrolase family protein n=1 Tax=Flexibacter flexilis DSM 6793 TaxID=927664 RepID=A0A1I1H0V0_9BACT|nr:hypothetical protein [Flexibacter flexilis]SFC17779.1 hypothetical protein SAMN05421780_103172 [Flexibacter flexilis DSM 6793]
MKLYLKTFIAFLIPIAITVIGTIYLYHQKINSIQLPKNIDTVICGDSHIMTGINDSLISNSLNIAQHSQNYIFTYNILSNIITNNPKQIREIIIGSSFHNFGQNWDKQLIDSETAGEIYIKYFPILNWESAYWLLKKNPVTALNTLPSITKQLLLATVKKYNNYNQYPFIGKYEPVSESRLYDKVIHISIERHYEKYPNQISGNQAEYLEKIIRLCNANSIKIVLVSTPLNYRYSNKIPKFNREYFEHTISKIDSQEVFLDYSNLKMEDKCFQDGDHLNKYGATIFSKIIDQRLKELPQ